MNTKTIFILTLFIGSWFTGQAQASLHLYMWEDSLAPEVIEQWQSTHSSRIELSFFDNDDERDKLMLNNEQLPFDIVTLDNVSAHYYGRSGALVDVSQLPNRTNNDLRWNQACGDYSVPYFWGVLGLAYRKSQFPTPPSSWRAITHPAPNHQGHIGMLADTVETLLPSLLVSGYDGNTESPQELKAAYQHTLAQLDDFLTFEYAISYVRTDENPKDLHLAMTYSGDQYALNQFLEEGDWAFVIPQEGSSVWVDCLAISAHSANIEQAKGFLNYLMKAQIAALNAKVIQVATPNSAAFKYLPADYLNDPTLFPSQEVLDKSYIDSQLSSASNTLRTKIINSILAKHETQH